MVIASYDFFNDRELGNSCIIVGGAPNINEVDFSKFEGKIISMGDIPLKLQEKCKIDYWVNANTYFPKPDVDYETLNKFEETILIFSNSVLGSVHEIDYSLIKENLKLDWFEYDQRHFDKMPCNKQIDHRFDLREELDCCRSIADITVQEYLQKKFDVSCHYSSASTVAIHALAFAMIMGFKKIYLVGIDIPIYEKHYTYSDENTFFGLLKALLYKTYNQKDWRMKRGTLKVYIHKIIAHLFQYDRKSLFYQDIPSILSDFAYLNNVCLLNDIELINLNCNSTLAKIHNLKTLQKTFFYN